MIPRSLWEPLYLALSMGIWAHQTQACPRSQGPPLTEPELIHGLSIILRCGCWGREVEAAWLGRWVLLGPGTGRGLHGQKGGCGPSETHPELTKSLHPLSLWAEPVGRCQRQLPPTFLLWCPAPVTLPPLPVSWREMR